jgi:hypothetical protein
LKKDRLYLLRPGFTNAGLGPFYCNDSVAVEGLLGFFPKLRELVEVHYLEFPRPRKPLVDQLGETNQSLPVLVLADETKLAADDPAPTTASGHRFYAQERAIRDYLSSHFGLPRAS